MIIKLQRKTDEVIKNESQLGEWKIQLVMLNNCTSFEKFVETRSINSSSNNIEIFMSSDTSEIIDKLFDTILKIFQEERETSFKEEANLFMKMLVYCIIIFIK